MMKLSSRLNLVAENVGEFSSLIDIGSDHGQLPIYLKNTYPERKIGASEAQKMPYKNLIGAIKDSGLEIETYFSDGLRNVPQADVITICGMGGLLIVKILNDTDYLEKYSPNLILEPQSNYQDVRCTLLEKGYKINKEIYVEEKKKFYPIIVASIGHEDAYSEEELLYGRYSLTNKDENLKKLLQNRKNIYENLPTKKEECYKIEMLLVKYFNYKC